MLIDARSSTTPDLRAGGTDLEDRRVLGLIAGPVTDLEPTPQRTAIQWSADGARIGTLVRVQTLADDAAIRERYPALAEAAAALATPQVRAVATMGGALLQRSRCWYYRQPRFSCFKKGGHACPARDGDHRYGVLIDLGPCIWPHPATLGVALAAYDASIETANGARMTMAQLFGDGSDPTRDHHLPEGQVLETVLMPPPAPGEHAGYSRATARHSAEWPLVEVVVRLVIDDGMIAAAAIAAGAVGNVPIRLGTIEQALHGRSIDGLDVFADAINALPAPFEATAYKRSLLRGCVKEALGLATGSVKRESIWEPGLALPWRSA
jgi:xanthine dehydrogenase YagS FAD-binding subunit